MKSLVVVSCGRAKIWKANPSAGPTAAKDAYTSTYFNLNKEYAEKFADKWVVLSAKYGFTEPSFVIKEDYNVTFKNKKPNPISVATLIKQIKEKGLETFDQVVVLGGRDYISVVREAFKNTNCKIVTPLEGLSIGLAMERVRGTIDSETTFR